jgi:hypothetical protein
MPANIYQRVVDGNEEGTMNMLREIGYPCPKSADEAAYMLYDYVQLGGDDAKTAIASIHPDKDIILDYCTPSTSNTVSADGSKPMNCDGCKVKAEGKSRFHADAATTTTGSTVSSSTWNWIIGGSAAVIVVGLAFLIAYAPKH